MFDAPIAGQSLTKKLGSRPYEKPPEINKVEEVLALYLDTLQQAETKDEVFTLMQRGIPIKAIVQGMTKKNVMDGIHTLDVAYVIEPILIEVIKKEADARDLDYLVSYEDLVKGRTVQKEKHDRQVNEMTQAQMEGNSPVDLKRMAGLPVLREDQGEGASLESEQTPFNAQQQPVEEEAVAAEQEPMRKGLMARVQ